MGVILLSIVGKVLAMFLLILFVPTIADEKVSKNNCGVRASSGTADMVFALRLLLRSAVTQTRYFMIRLSSSMKLVTP